MEVHARKPFSTRTLSSSSLRERLSSLTTANLRPSVSIPAFHPNIEFVPSKIPRKRRLQTLAVATWSTNIVWAPFLFFLLLSFPPLWPVIAAYMVWILCIDKSPECGGRFSPGFSIDNPSLTSHTGTGFSRAYPGIRPHLLTLASNFRIPFYRDILLALGICSVSKSSCSNILKGGPGEAITIVVGGAAESLSARPGTADLTLRKRLSADLVPVFSFGENDASRFTCISLAIYQQMPNEKGTTVYTLQKKFQNMFGFTLPLFHGRGLLNYNLGLMPYRRRIVAVIGRPIHVKRCEKPTLEEITHVQTQYIEELMHIWHTYKDDFARSRTRELSIIE
ncbi:DAGAT-domain-containing protein [Amylocystis lapponica]|nr:DAGAT-domain-containing protein [Amylocystis lapponica]